MPESVVIGACPGCGRPLVRVEVGGRDVRCLGCLGTYRVLRGRLLRRFSRVVTDSEPHLLLAGRYHRKEDLHLDVGGEEPTCVTFRTPGQWDALPLKDGNDAVVVGALGRKGRLEVAWVADATSGAAARVRDLTRHSRATALAAGFFLPCRCWPASDGPRASRGARWPGRSRGSWAPCSS